MGASERACRLVDRLAPAGTLKTGELTRFDHALKGDILAGGTASGDVAYWTDGPAGPQREGKRV